MRNRTIILIVVISIVGPGCWRTRFPGPSTGSQASPEPAQAFLEAGSTRAPGQVGQSPNFLLFILWYSASATSVSYFRLFRHFSQVLPSLPSSHTISHIWYCIYIYIVLILHCTYIYIYMYVYKTWYQCNIKSVQSRRSHFSIHYYNSKWSIIVKKSNWHGS